MNILKMAIPDLEQVTLRSLHRKPASLSESFLNVGMLEKHDALLSVLSEEEISPSSQKAQKWIVFCNTIQSCRSTEHFLRENGFHGTYTLLHGRY